MCFQAIVFGIFIFEFIDFRLILPLKLIINVRICFKSTEYICFSIEFAH